jgi:hypothetical protein
MTVIRIQIPKDLQAAIEAGKLSQEQLSELIALEAMVIGLTYEQAVDAAQRDALPDSPLSPDLSFLVDMLDDTKSATE